jgi:hypothetical protein
MAKSQPEACCSTPVEISMERRRSAVHTARLPARAAEQSTNFSRPTQFYGPRRRCTTSREVQTEAFQPRRWHQIAATGRKEKIIKTIAAMANRGFDVAYIVFRGDLASEAQIDAAELDDAIRKTLYPSVSVELEGRRIIDGFAVDFLRIAGGQNRPHFMRNASNEMTIPFRGAANNTMAARHELDEMYRERTIDLIRRALAGGSPAVSDEDPVLTKLQEIDWGNASSATDPEFIFSLVPTRDDRARPLRDLIESRSAHVVVNNAVLQIVSKEASDWLAGPTSDLVSAPREDYLEVWQPARDGHRIGTILLYESGIVIVRIWILEPFMDGERAFSFNHFKSAFRASLWFASLIYQHATVPIGPVDVRGLIINAQDLDLWMTPSNNPKIIRQNKDVGRYWYLPKRPIEVNPGSLEAEADSLAERFGKSLLAHYGTG